MPEISRFYGLRITMNYNEHLPPHFHVQYAEHEAQVGIATGEVINGCLPGRACAMVSEWATLHRAELEEDWRLRGLMQPLNRIEGLE
jgi:hypothetical protein